MQFREQTNNLKVQSLLSQVRVIEKQRDKEIEVLEEQIQAVKSEYAKQASAHKDELNKIAAAFVLEKHGIKEGDIVECWHGRRKTRTRSIRIDAIFIEVSFMEWDGVEHSAGHLRVVGTHIKKDGSEGERGINVYEESPVKKASQQTA